MAPGTRDPVRPRECGVPWGLAGHARPLSPRAGPRGVRVGRQPCGAGHPAVGPPDGAEPLPDPEGPRRVARADVPGGPGPPTDQVGACSEAR